MSKRKRGEYGEDNEDETLEIDDQALRIKVSRLRAKFDQSIKIVAAALKLSRGFERQKLGRRQKNAGNEPHTLLRLREEVIVLKQLQLDQTAKDYVLRQLVKTKRIKESSPFLTAFGTDPKLLAVKPGAEANVLGRLFNSTPVRQAMPDVMKSFYNILNLTDAKAGKMPSAKSLEVETPSLSEQTSGSTFEGFSDTGEHIELSDEEHSIDKHTRVRLSSTDEGSENELSISPRAYDNRVKPARQAIDQDDGEFSASVSLSSDHDDEDNTTSRRALKTPHLAKEIASTAFLPSLNMGGYYSGSESDEDGPQFNVRGPAMPQIRKNRRGQRARQQLAEKKYGKNAKHLQNQKETPRKDGGWDARKGAVGPSNRRKGYSGGEKWGEERGNRVNTRQAPSEKPKRRDDTGPLHPSWEAAKLRKSQGPTQAAFAGKRITFD